MSLNFDSLPTDKPASNSNVTPGRHAGVIFKSEFRTSKTSGQEYLNVSIKLDDGGFVNENYFDSDKPFLMYKLSRLLKACKVSLAGEGTLKDVAKVIANKRVVVDVVLNDRGYGTLDYSEGNEGIYPEGAEPAKTDDGMDADVIAAIGEEVVIDDEF